jgi:phage-related protein
LTAYRDISISCRSEHQTARTETLRLYWLQPWDLKRFPAKVQNRVGYALSQVQDGDEPISAKALKGFGGRAVLELVDDFDSDTYRAVYTVRFAGVVYVLHAFQKKAKKGIATPRQDLDLIRSRLRDAELHYRARTDKGGCKP